MSVNGERSKTPISDGRVLYGRHIEGNRGAHRRAGAGAQGKVCCGDRPLVNFFSAEEYHRNYLDKNPNGYCHIPRAEIELFSQMKIDPGDYRKPAAEAIRDRLTDEQYRVTQEGATESPFRNEFWNQFESGCD